MERLLQIKNLIDILIEKEQERKLQCMNNWNVSEYAYHNGKESAYREIKREILISLVSD